MQPVGACSRWSSPGSSGITTRRRRSRTVALIDLGRLVGEERKYGQLTVEPATEIALAGVPGDCPARDVRRECEGVPRQANDRPYPSPAHRHARPHRPLGPPAPSPSTPAMALGAPLEGDVCRRRRTTDLRDRIPGGAITDPKWKTRTDQCRPDRAAGASAAHRAAARGRLWCRRHGRYRLPYRRCWVCRRWRDARMLRWLAGCVAGGQWTVWTICGCCAGCRGR